MSNYRQRLTQFLMTHPLVSALVLGALARAMAATFGMSFHARDDYFHVLEPALAFLADPHFHWEQSTLAGAGIRSHLVPRLVTLLLQAAHATGFTSPKAALQFVYCAIGAYSLLSIVGVHVLSGRLLSPPARILATFFSALHFAMPYAGTRLLIEAMAMPPFLFALYVATWPKPSRFFLSGMLLGLACWLRLQVAAAAIGMFVTLAFSSYRVLGTKKAAAYLSAFVGGGLLTFLLQGLFDLATAGKFLGPLLGNLAANAKPQEELTRSSTFSYLGMWLLLTVPPATLVIFPPLVSAMRRIPLISVSFLSFVFLHSLIPHKEERFMLPILPLFLMLLAAAIVLLWTPSYRQHWPRLTRFAKPTVLFLLVIHGVALGIAITNQSQKNLFQAMDTLAQDPQASAAISLGPEWWAYFLGNLPSARNSRFDALWFHDTWQSFQAQQTPVNRILSFDSDTQKVHALFEKNHLECEKQAVFAGYWLDRLIFAINPKHNRRRSPIVLWACEPGSEE